jgi:hypothetical protein
LNLDRQNRPLSPLQKERQSAYVGAIMQGGLRATLTLLLGLERLLSHARDWGGSRPAVFYFHSISLNDRNWGGLLNGGFCLLAPESRLI